MLFKFLSAYIYPALMFHQYWCKILFYLKLQFLFFVTHATLPSFKRRKKKMQLPIFMYFLHICDFHVWKSLICKTHLYSAPTCWITVFQWRKALRSFGEMVMKSVVIYMIIMPTRVWTFLLVMMMYLRSSLVANLELKWNFFFSWSKSNSDLSNYDILSVFCYLRLHIRHVDVDYW